MKKANYWPKEVRIPDSIGIINFTKNHAPCCAIGHLRSETSSGDVEQIFREAYTAVAATDEPGYLYEPVEVVNDNTTSVARKLYYNTAWALLGYTEGQSRSVRSLAKRTRENLLSRKIYLGFHGVLAMIEREESNVG